MKPERRRKATLTPPIKWHGGKNAFNGALARWIIQLMPKHLHYVEPFAGGAAVLLHKDPTGVSEVINDCNSSLMTFWEVLRDTAKFAEFCRLVSATPVAEQVFDNARDVLVSKSASNVEKAVAFFVLCRQSRQALQKDFVSLSRTRVRRGMNEQASAWLTAIDGLADVHARLQQVVILCRDGFDVIASEDTEDTLFYVDCPYLHITRKSTKDYDHEFTDAKHDRLLRQLAGIRGKFILSGYRSEKYDTAAALNGWSCAEYRIANNASSQEVKPVMTEVVWYNF